MGRAGSSTQRLRNALPGFTATAGIADAETLRSRDDLFREADMALLGAKRLHQHAAIYTTEMDPEAGAPADDKRNENVFYEQKDKCRNVRIVHSVCRCDASKRSVSR